MRFGTTQVGLTRDALVWLNPYRSPVTPLERRVYGMLANGPVRLAGVVELLAEDSVYEQHRAGVWPLEIGAEALPVLRLEAHLALMSLDGNQIAIETPPPVRAIAYASWQLQLCA